jgi:hypothetical protein
MRFGLRVGDDGVKSAEEVMNLSVAIGWLGATSSGAGYYLYKSDAEMWGKYIGITVNSTSTPFVINGFQFEHELRTRF